jgi:hypothetical protein
MNILDIIARSKANMKVTPTERAVLQAMQGVLISFLSMLLPYLNDILAGKYQIDYVHLIEVIGTAMILAGLSKYISAVSPEQQALTKKMDAEADELTRNEVGTILNSSLPMAVSNAGYTTAQVTRAFHSPLILPGGTTKLPIITNTGQGDLTEPPSD